MQSERGRKNKRQTLRIEHQNVQERMNIGKKKQKQKLYGGTSTTNNQQYEMDCGCENNSETIIMYQKVIFFSHPLRSSLVDAQCLLFRAALHWSDDGKKKKLKNVTKCIEVEGKRATTTHKKK